MTKKACRKDDLNSALILKLFNIYFKWMLSCEAQYIKEDSKETFQNLWNKNKSGYKLRGRKRGGGQSHKILDRKIVSYY